MRKFDIYYGPGRRRTRRFVLTWVGTFVMLLMIMWWINSKEAGMQQRRMKFREAVGRPDEAPPVGQHVVLGDDDDEEED